MALIKCLECGKEISDKAENCPHCGYPLKSNQNKEVINKKIKKPNIRKILFVCLILLVIISAGLSIFLFVIKPIVTYNNAVTEYNNGNYEQSIKLLNTIPKYKDVPELLDEVKLAQEISIYNEACMLLNNGDLQTARELIENIPNYVGAQELLEQVEAEEKYNNVLMLYEKKEYVEALNVLETIPKHEKYSEMKVQIENAQKDNTYNEALALLEQGKYKEAKALLDTIITEMGVYKLQQQIRYETFLYECIRDFEKYLKNPDSLIIYEVVFYKKWEKPSALPYCIIKYGGQNGFGGISTGYVIYEDSGKENVYKYKLKGACDSLVGIENDTSEKRAVCSDINVIMYFESDKVGDVDLNRVKTIIENKLHKSIELMK